MVRRKFVRDPGPETASASAAPSAKSEAEKPAAGLFELAIGIGGIYASFLTWAYLQERMTSRPLSEGGPFKQSVVVYALQSIFAVITGSIYLHFSSEKVPGQGRNRPPVFPSTRILGPLILIAFTSTFSASFAYASLQYVDYITFLLAKSSKLLPVMVLQVTFFRRQYPISKYAVVAAVTAGVAIFTVYHPSVAVEAARRSAQKVADAAGHHDLGVISSSTAWGIILLSINLLFDGITNSVQDHIFTEYKGFTGQQMMVAHNMLMAVLNLSYLIFFPRLARSPIGSLIGLAGPSGVVEDQLRDGVRFLIQWPAARWDVLGFALCGAIGQIFIFFTLARFSSIVLVTVNVTRKMLTMLLSIVLFGHSITSTQWLGVGLVFGGIGAEAALERQRKLQAAKEKKAKKLE